MGIPLPLRLFFACCLGGFALAALFLGALLLTMPLLRGAGCGPLAVLWFFCGMGFAGGQWGTALAWTAGDGPD